MHVSYKACVQVLIINPKCMLSVMVIVLYICEQECVCVTNLIFILLSLFYESKDLTALFFVLASLTLWLVAHVCGQ